MFYKNIDFFSIIIFIVIVATRNMQKAILHALYFVCLNIYGVYGHRSRVQCTLVKSFPG